MTRKSGNWKRTTRPKRWTVNLFHYSLSNSASMSWFVEFQAEASGSLNFWNIPPLANCLSSPGVELKAPSPVPLCPVGERSAF